MVVQCKFDVAADCSFLVCNVALMDSCLAFAAFFSCLAFPEFFFALPLILSESVAAVSVLCNQNIVNFGNCDGMGTHT